MALISVSVALSQTPAYGVPVYALGFTGTELYCLVTEAHGCEQLILSLNS